MNITWLNYELVRIGEMTVRLFDVVVFGGLLLFFILLSALMRKAITRLADGRDIGEQANIHIIGKLVYYLLMVIGILVALSSLGLDVGKIALVASALSVGIGFGLQSIFNNFVSGIILLFERSVKVGDVVELADGLLGTVKEINIRSTRVNTPDNMDVIVPNSEFVSNRINNWTYTDRYRRVRVPFGVHYKSDKEQVREVVLEAAAKVPLTIMDVPDKEPKVWLINFGESSLDFELIVWADPKAVTKPLVMRAAYLWEIETALREHGIEIPYPQRDLHLRSSGVSLLQPLAPAANPSDSPAPVNEPARDRTPE